VVLPQSSARGQSTKPLPRETWFRHTRAELFGLHRDIAAALAAMPASAESGQVLPAAVHLYNLDASDSFAAIGLTVRQFRHSAEPRRRPISNYRFPR
jgi:hypothetical protein